MQSLRSCWVVFILICVGCAKSGQELAPVQGRVTLDGKPLQSGEVTFQPAGKSFSIGRTDSDGHYELWYKRGLAGGMIGDNAVSIRVNTQETHGPQTVPAKYNTESELRRDVKPGPNVFDFDLTT